MAYSTDGIAYGGDLRRGRDRDDITQGEQGMSHQQIDGSSNYEDGMHQGSGSNSFHNFKHAGSALYASFRGSPAAFA